MTTLATSMTPTDAGVHSVPVFDDDGKPVKARFSAWVVEDAWHVVLESRGGAIGKQSERNPGYSSGLRVLLTRLGELGSSVLDAFVESTHLIRQGLTLDERRVHAVTFPIAVSSQSEVALAASLLQGGQRTVGASDSQSGGNTTRRLLILANRTRPSGFDITGFLSAHVLSPGEPVPLGAIPVSGSPDSTPTVPESFDPTGIVDARRRVLVALAQREGQPAFRRKLLAAYGSRCAITGCDLLDALEAAHIVPYWGPHTNHVQNGILLRADLHTLFDRGLFGIEPTTFRVRVDPRIVGTQYEFLHDRLLAVPEQVELRPSAEALQRHLSAVGLESLP